MTTSVVVTYAATVAAVSSATVTNDPTSWQVVCDVYDACDISKIGDIHSVDDDVTATGIWTDSIAEKGFANLEVHTKGAANDTIKAFSAGYLEGYVTQQRTYEYWFNTLKTFDVTDSMIHWIEENLAWMEVQIKANLDDPYFQQVGYLLR